jgi:diadenosine tetraphosphatase ApaH/serine/threonine PP2A family protein phosphatase
VAVNIALMDRRTSALPTKLGQAPTSSPRTTEKRRKNLGSLFSSLTFRSVSPVVVPPAQRGSGEDGEPDSTCIRDRSPDSWFSASITTAATTHDEDEGCYIDDGSQRSSMVTTAEGLPSQSTQQSLLMELPDEL